MPCTPTFHTEPLREADGPSYPVTCTVCGAFTTGHMTAHPRCQVTSVITIDKPKATKPRKANICVHVYTSIQLHVRAAHVHTHVRTCVASHILTGEKSIHAAEGPKVPADSTDGSHASCSCPAVGTGSAVIQTQDPRPPAAWPGVPSTPRGVAADLGAEGRAFQPRRPCAPGMGSSEMASPTSGPSAIISAEISVSFLKSSKHIFY